VRTVTGSTTRGLAAVQRNLTKEIGGIVNRTASGVIKAALHLQRSSMPEAPILTGTLRNSCVVTNGTIGKNPVAAVSYLAGYAGFVHENMNAAHHVGKAKFLQDPAMREQSRMVQIIAEDARLKK
jgi:hypothetical protein